MIDSKQYPCQFCKWSGTNQKALDYHLRTYHEAKIAQEGNNDSRKVSDVSDRNTAYLLKHGYVFCKIIGTACIGPGYKLMRKACPFIKKCTMEVDVEITQG